MERRYESGRRAKLLDIIRIPLKEHLPEGHQQENHVIDEDYYWEKQGDATWEQMVALEDPYDAAFWVQAEHTYHGLNDKVRESRTAIESLSRQFDDCPRLSPMIRSQISGKQRGWSKTLRG